MNLKRTKMYKKKICKNAMQDHKKWIIQNKTKQKTTFFYKLIHFTF